jgi:NADH-quinone oxidoreductase subunit C
MQLNYGDAMSSTYLSEALKNKLKASFQAVCKVKDGFLLVRIRRQSYVAVAEYLKKQGFSRLLTVSAIDWMDEDEFEVYFIVHSIEENLYVKASTRIPGSRPEIESLSSLWDNSSMHEREAWELFGITFKGNNMLKPLFLEGWTGPPPFLKNFNWREYVKNTRF